MTNPEYRQLTAADVDEAAQVVAQVYEHFGFECVEASPVSNTGITVYALKRPIQGEQTL